MAIYFKASMDKRKLQPKSFTRKVRKKSSHLKLLSKNHFRALLDAWKQMKQTPISTFITSTVIAMAILLTATLLITFKTFQQVTKEINSMNQVTIYLKSPIQDSQIKYWVNNLKKNPLIKNVTFISPKAALQELLVQQSDYKNILSNLEENPLPPVILLKLNMSSKEEIKRLVSQLKTMPIATMVHLDFEWLERFSSLLKLGSRINCVLSFLFSIGILAIISHTIQGATQRNQQEMYILQLIGANIPFIRRPFLYIGTLLGFLAGLLATLLIAILFSLVQYPLLQFFQSYNISYSNLFINFNLFIFIILLSTFLGWLGANISFYKYTKLL